MYNRGKLGADVMIRDILIFWAKEFRFYFQSRMIYLVLLLYAAISVGMTLYVSDFYQNTTAGLYQFFKFQPGIMALIIPALTMRFWADEYKHNTLEIVFSQPVDYAAVAIGKFLAAWSITGIMLISSTGLWLVVGVMIPLDNGWIAANYLISFLMSGSLCAVSAAAAAFCYNALGAFLASMIAGMLLATVKISLWVENLLPDNAAIAELSKVFDFTRQFDDLISGQAGVAAGVYFLVLTAAGLWISVAAAEYKRS